MKHIISNWKTTSAGIIAIISGVTFYTQDKTKIVEASTAILTGIGLLFAGDAKGEAK